MAKNTDPTVEALTVPAGTEIGNLRARRLGIEGLITTIVSGDLDSQAKVLGGLNPLIALDAGSFYATLPSQLAAANAAAAAAIAKQLDPRQDPVVAGFDLAAAAEVSAVIVRRSTIQTIVSSTVSGDTVSAAAALAKLDTISRPDANPFYVALPTLQANAAAVVAEPVPPPVGDQPVVLVAQEIAKP